MAKTLPFVSYSGSDPEFEIRDEGFSELEKAYATAIPAVARQELISLGAAYLFSRRIEISQQDWRDVEAILPTFERAANAIWAIAYESPPQTDAGSQFEHIFERHLGAEPISIRPDRDQLLFIDKQSENRWQAFGERFQIPEGGYAFRPTRQMIHEFAMALRVAVNRTASEIRKELVSPEPARQSAIDALIMGLTDWAKTFGLPCAPYIDGERPNKFSRFACAVLTFVPQQFRESRYSTEGAMAGQVRRVRQAATARKREQTRSRLLDKNAP